LFNGETLSALLFALATGYPDRAKNVVLTCAELGEEERGRLWPIIADPATTVAVKAHRLGDAIRELGADWSLTNECYRLAFYLSGASEALSGNPLYAYFAAHRSGRLLNKWIHYFPIYDRHLAPYRDRGAKVLEIGVFHGGSLDMWERYLGPSTELVGVDIDPQARMLADPGRTVVIGDQADRGFLQSLVDEYGPFDVVLDDGGHTVKQQITSIETLFPTLIDGGIYIVEDSHTSYWESYGGGLEREGTFVEWVKSRIDDLHRYHLPDPVDPIWTVGVDGIHCYDSVVVLDKKSRLAPFSEQAGMSSFVYRPERQTMLVGEMLATRDAAINAQEAAATAQEVAISERHAIEVKLGEIESELLTTRTGLQDSWAQLRAMRTTVSWRITMPLRAVRRLTRRM
jgi:hypothetical protein